MTVYDWFQLTGGVILALGYLPQIRQLLTTRSCKDLNINTYISLATGIGMMEIYAYNLWMNHSAGMFFATNTISLATGSMLLLILLLRVYAKFGLLWWLFFQLYLQISRMNLLITFRDLFI